MTAADPHQLQQVFLNLVNNAVDAMLEHASDGDLRVSTRAIDERLIIEFQDSGPGVKDASRVFDPFYTTKPVGKGTGQGLALAHSVITEKHGGVITFESEPGKGTTFIIRLPLVQCSATAKEKVTYSLRRHDTYGDKENRPVGLSGDFFGIEGSSEDDSFEQSIEKPEKQLTKEKHLIRVDFQKSENLTMVVL